jgi:hypothetical protein
LNDGAQPGISNPGNRFPDHEIYPGMKPTASMKTNSIPSLRLLNAIAIILAGAAPLAMGLPPAGAPPMLSVPRIGLGGSATATSMGALASPVGTAGASAAGTQSLTGSATAQGTPAVSGAAAVNQGAVETIGMREDRVQAMRVAEIENGPSGSAIMAIQDGSFDSQAAISSGITARLNADDAEFVKMKAASAAGAQLRTASAEVAVREQTLRASAKAASTATAGSWESARAELSADYSAYAAAAARARVIAVSGAAGANASTKLSAGATIDSLHAVRFEAREQAAESVKARLAASGEAVATLRERGASLGGQSKADFRVAAADMKAGDKRLKASIQAAEKSDAKGWTVARARLAADYGSYAEAVARAELAASASAQAKVAMQ